MAIRVGCIPSWRLIQLTWETLAEHGPSQPSETLVLESDHPGRKVRMGRFLSLFTGRLDVRSLSAVVSSVFFFEDVFCLCAVEELLVPHYFCSCFSSFGCMGRHRAPRSPRYSSLRRSSAWSMSNKSSSVPCPSIFLFMLLSSLS